MAIFNFTQNEYAEETADHSSVERRFETDELGRIVEEFVWFLRASGFDYVDSVSVNDGEHGFSL